ncbi:hypothetical protein CW304_14425 [Bacillus sp. UFRGS-B20]|nr:hypothetical protein CW304_14425 [Bacillus sp. UFRGS-B20]
MQLLFIKSQSLSPISFCSSNPINLSSIQQILCNIKLLHVISIPMQHITFHKNYFRRHVPRMHTACIEH